jgi:hypothetical protein
MKMSVNQATAVNAAQTIAEDAEEYDEGTEAYVAGIMALPPAEKARYVAQSGSMILEMLTEAHRRQAALYEILQVIEMGGNDCDDLEIQVHDIYEIYWCLADYALKGDGLDWGHDEPRGGECFHLDAAASTELRRRLTQGPRR